MPRIRPAAATALLCALLLPLCARATATPLAAGDLVVSSLASFDGRPVRLLRVDQQTGAENTISSGGALSNGCFVFDTDGSIFMGAPGALIRIDANSGAQSGVSTGGFFASTDVGGVVINHANELITSTANRKIVRVNRSTGVQNLLATVSGTGVVTNIAVTPNGDYLATAIDDNLSGRLVRIDHTTFAQTVVSSGALLQLPVGIAVSPSGEIYVSDVDGYILQIDPVTGFQFRLGYVGTPSGLALRSSTNELFVADQESGVFRYNLATGVQSLISPVGDPACIGFATIPSPSPILALAAAAPFTFARRRRRSLRA